MSVIDVSKIKLSQLRALAAVAEHGSFGEAALSLNVSQSAVSHAIASLESELGVVVCSRGRHGASLTFVGQQILDTAQQIFKLVDRLAEQANASKSAQTGQVRIATIRSLATYWLPSVMSLFNQKFPQITVTITKYFDHVAIQAALRDRVADVGLTDIYNQDGYTVFEIGWDPYVALLPANGLPPDQPFTWQHVEHYPLIMPSPKDRGYDALREYVDSLDHPPKIAYEINEDAAIVSMVAQGMGMTILPYFATLPVPDTVQIRQLPHPLTRLLAAVIMDDVLHPPAVFTFLDTIKQAELPLVSTSEVAR